MVPCLLYTSNAFTPLQLATYCATIANNGTRCLLYTSYPDGTLGRDMFGIRTKEDVTSATNTVFQQLHSYYQKERQSIPITYSLTIKRGTPVTVTVSDHEQHTVTVEGDIPVSYTHLDVYKRQG